MVKEKFNYRDVGDLLSGKKYIINMLFVNVYWH